MADSRLETSLHPVHDLGLLPSACVPVIHLSMNVAKCKYIIATKKRQPDVPPVGLQLGGVIIEQVKQYRYLGVLVDEHISWSEHIKQLCSKVRKLIGMLYIQTILYMGRHLYPDNYILNLYTSSP